MRRRIRMRGEQWLVVARDEPAIRINWPRVAFAALLAAAVTVLVTLRFQATREQNPNPQAASGGPEAAIEVSSAPKADFQARSEQNPDGPSAATEVLSATKADLSRPLQLFAEPAAQGTNDGLPLGISIRGPSEIASAAAIDIGGLPNEWALSAGWPIANGWRIPAARLSGAVIIPPRGFSGAIDFTAELRLADNTLVERQLVRRVRIDPRLADGVSRAALLLGETPEPVMIDPGLADKKTMSLLRGADGLLTASLLRTADGLLAAGDIAAARLVLQRAAEAGSARAALLLGETYDGCLIRRSNCSADVNSPTARTWYEVAAEFGSTDARLLLHRLSRNESGGDLPNRR
jgi:hypothetical protein